MNATTKVPFALAVFGLMILAAILFVVTQLVFRDQPDVQKIFSLIWTVALGVLLYRLLVTRRSEQGQVKRTDLYGLMRFMVELIAVVTLLFAAIMASVVLTSPGNNAQLALTIAITGILAVLLLLIPRLLRLFTRHDSSVDKPPKS